MEVAESSDGPPDESVPDDEDLVADLRAAFGVDEGAKSASFELTRAASIGASGAGVVGSLSIGSRLGDFEILSELGRGGMGIVYRAKQLALDRDVALKVLPGQARRGRLSVRRFRTEAQAAARLNHANVVPVYAQGEQQGHYFYAMKLVDGKSLDHVIKTEPNLLSSGNALPDKSTPLTGGADSSGPSLSLDQTSMSSSGPDAEIRSRSRADYRHLASLVAGAAEGLAHAHSHGVIHRDIKPHNLILGPDQRIYITDFGLAHLVDEPHLTLTGEVIGTPLYLAPEQVRGDTHSIDERTDVYALGITLYELLTGVRPFDRPTRDQVLHAICTDELVRPRQILHSVPVDLETICLRSCQKEQSARYQTAAALAEDLRRFSESRPVLTRRVGRLERILKWVRRHKPHTVALVATLAVLVAGSGWAWTSRAARRREGRDAVASAYHQLVHLNYRKPWLVAEDLERARSLGAMSRDLGVVEALVHIVPSDTREREKAVTILQALREVDPSDQEVAYLLAWTLWKLDRTEESRRVFEETDASSAPETPEAWFFRGLAAHRDRPEVAVESYRNAIHKRSEQDAYFPQAVLHLSRAHNQTMYATRSVDSFEEARTGLEQLVKHHQYGAYPHYLLSITYRLAAEVYAGSTTGSGDENADDRFQESLEWAREGQRVDPNDNRPITAEAMCLQRLGRFSEALDARNRAIALSNRDDHRCEGYHYRWRLHYWLGHFQDALVDIDRQLSEACSLSVLDLEDIRSLRFYSHFYPALVYAEMGQMEDALDLARSLADDAPQDAHANLISAACLRILGREQEALDRLVEGREQLDFESLLPDSRDAQWETAVYDFATHELSFEQLMDLAKNREYGQRSDLEGEAHFHAGAIWLAAGDRERAKNHFEAAYRSFDGWVDYTFHGRLLFVQLSRFERWPPWIEVANP